MNNLIRKREIAINWNRGRARDDSERRGNKFDQDGLAENKKMKIF